MTDIVEQINDRLEAIMDSNNLSVFRAAAAEITTLRKELAEARAENERFREALTPSGETKAHYIGEFSFDRTEIDEYGRDFTVKVYVPWTTIKEIMAAISARAADGETKP